MRACCIRKQAFNNPVPVWPELKAETMTTAVVTGTACPLENYLVLPDTSMDARIAAAKAELGNDCIVLGHHYQRDEVVRSPTTRAIRTGFLRSLLRLARATSFSAAYTSWPKAPMYLDATDR